MISYSEALAMLEASAGQRVLAIETVSLSACRGRILAEEIKAGEFVPSFDNSAMDGFALAAALTSEATIEKPVILAVGQCVSAGDRPEAFSSVAVEIMTGAPLPAGAFDTVVRIEDVEVTRIVAGVATRISLSRPVAVGTNIRRSGEDFRPGQGLGGPGVVLGANHIMAFASLGISEVKVYRRPSIAVLSTGRELVPYSTARLAPGMIRNSSAPYLIAELETLGASVRYHGVIADDEADFIARLDAILADNPDVIVTTGAVSMGKHDFIEPALRKIGASIRFHKSAIRPGKPILFAEIAPHGPDSSHGTHPRTVLFGLPGNPISTAVGLRFFVTPYLRRLIGQGREMPLTAILRDDCKRPRELHCFFKAHAVVEDGQYRVRALSGQASFMISPFLESNVWLSLPAGAGEVKAGERVGVFPLLGSVSP